MAFPAARARPAILSVSPRIIVVCALLGALAAGVLAAISPVLVPAVIGGLFVGATVVADPTNALDWFLVLVATLPFGVVPIRAGGQLTFLDALLLVAYLSFLFWAAGRLRERKVLRAGRVGFLVLTFIAISAVAYTFGLQNSPATPELTRSVVTLVASILVFLVALNLVADRERVRSLARGITWMGAFAGAVGSALWMLPSGTQLRLLTALRVVGYPTTDVLRYIPGPNNTYTTHLRATGTAVDPNVFGGTVMVALCIGAVQWLTRAPLSGWRERVLVTVPAAAGLLLSQSRGAWVGAAAGIGLIAVIRYRRLLLLGPLALAALVALPAAHSYVQRFVGGFSSTDPATALRFGEYHNALTLISQFPLLGIGFGASPDPKVTAGVSSMYLLVGEQTGLIGLGVYLIAVGSVFALGLAAFARRPRLDMEGALGGLLAAFTAMLVAGAVDHYFANQVFPHTVALFWLTAALLVRAADLSVRPAAGDPGPSS